MANSIVSRGDYWANYSNYYIKGDVARNDVRMEVLREENSYQILDGIPLYKGVWVLLQVDELISQIFNCELKGSSKLIKVNVVIEYIKIEKFLFQFKI